MKILLIIVDIPIKAKYSWNMELFKIRRTLIANNSNNKMMDRNMPCFKIMSINKKIRGVSILNKGRKNMCLKYWEIDRFYRIIIITT